MTIAQFVCYCLTAMVGLLIVLDVWLAATGRELITTAARAENSATGWLVAGAYAILGVHLFALPYLIQAWHWLMKQP